MRLCAVKVADVFDISISSVKPKLTAFCLSGGLFCFKLSVSEFLSTNMVLTTKLIATIEV